VAHLLNVETAGVAHAGRDLLDGVSLGLDDGDRVGIVGRNGAGKSTLLRLLARQQAPDSGRVTHARGLRLGALSQTDDVEPGVDVRAAVVGSAAAHEWAADARVRDVMTGLLGGVDAPGVGGLDAPLTRLSGGQRRRVALAALLIREHDVVLLDEPTNHLDVEGVDWLARHLARRWPAGRGALAVVTHDRWFLDAVCTRTWEVHDGVVDGYEGGYAAWVLARAERDRIAAATQARRLNLMRKELAWLRRGPPARTSKPKFRIEAAQALIADEPPPRDSMALTRMATARLGKDVVDLEDVTLGYEGRVLLDRVTWRLAPGERVGVVGVNGAGKTTLMRLVTGELRPDSGRVRRGKTVQSAMLTQDVRELDAVAGLRVQEAVEKVRGAVRIGDREVTAGQLLERLGFTKDRVWTPVSELSGGERRRLQLLRLLMAEPNVLLLDEPTNDLDTDTLAAVEDTLDGWPGTLVVVSHDRYLLERISDHQVALLGDGKVRDLPGGVDQYLELRRAAEAAAGAAAPAAAGPTVTDAGEQRAARKEMARLERQISRLQGQEAKLHEKLAAAATDHEVVLTLDAELRGVVAEREALEEQWLEAAETAG
jgi:ATP-binding cassette subfamily F protein uup